VSAGFSTRCLLRSISCSRTRRSLQRSRSERSVNSVAAAEEVES
jgi:hypothetical protein